MPNSIKVVALIAAYNEADVIGHVLDHLIAEGCQAYLLDDGSTDATVAEAERYLGKGLIGLERRQPVLEGTDVFRWGDILRRKSELAGELDADWFIHHDADEFRESPWIGLSLRDAVWEVDRRGYNAIDFDVLNFVPTRDSPQGVQDPRAAFHYYERAQKWDRLQVKCWKNLPSPIDLVSSGGHDVSFVSRRVFPIRFLLRHYPIRGQAHGERKVFRERKPRFAESERSKGWHVQYEGIGEGHQFVRDSSGLACYDPYAARIDVALDSRDLEAAHRRISELDGESAFLRAETAARAADQSALRAELDARAAQLDALRIERDARVAELNNALTQRDAEIDARKADQLALRAELDARIAQLSALRVATDGEISRRDVALAEKVSEIEARKTDQLALRAELDARIAQLSALRVATDGEIRRRDVALAETALELEHLTRTDAGLRAELARLAGVERELAAAIRTAENARQEVERVAAQLTEVYASRSWRITEPLRRVQRFFTG